MTLSMLVRCAIFIRLARPVALLLAAMLPGWMACGENWPQWRGPHFNGASDEKGLPTNWSKQTVAWTAEMAGPSAGTPAIWEDLVFVSTADFTTVSLRASCLDRKTGKLLWDHKVGEGKIQKDDRSNFASPSPVVDGQRCYFFYGNGALVAYDHAGKELWSRNLTKDYGDFPMNWTFSSTPTLWEGKLYAQVLVRDVPVRRWGGRGGWGGDPEDADKTQSPSQPHIDSYLLVMDPATGKTLARVVRPTDAQGESHDAYSTPIPFDDHGHKEILINGADYLTAHDADTAQEVWRSPDLNRRRSFNGRTVPSPVAVDGVVLACQPQRSPIFAIKPNGAGALSQTAILWDSENDRDLSSDVPTPLVYEGDFFILNESKRKLARVEPTTGKVKWKTDLPGRRLYQASPTGADGKIYLMNFAGDVVVVDAASGQVLSTMAMGEEGDDMIRSTIAVSHRELFIRTNSKLFCVAAQ